MTFQVGRRLWVVAVAMIALIVLPVAAFADDISNSLDNSVDAVAEVMPLTVGGANGTTQLYVVPANEDGKNGCNLTGSTTLVVSVSSSNTAVATVSPSSITFGSCGDSHAVTVTAVAQGSATIRVSQTSNDTGGTFNLAPAAFTVNVTAPAPVNTAPRISITGVEGGASYNKGSVPAATCQVTDAEDGNSSFAATPSPITGVYASDGIGQQTASCSYTDRGGLTASDSVTYNIVDPSAPTIGPTLDPLLPDGSNGWYKSNVSLTWNVSDAESPNSLQKSDCVNQNITADQLETTYSCSATSAGGSAGPVSVSIKRDETAPVISGSDINDTAWHNSAFARDFTATDATSGLAAPSDAAFTLTASTESADASTPASVSKTVRDNAGNTATRSISAFIDLTDPEISATLDRDAATSGWYNIATGAPTVRFECSDALSGLAGACPSAHTFGEGADQSYEGTVQDLAGNSATDGVSDVDVDLTAPTIRDNGPTSAPNGNGWYKNAVTNTFSTSDDTSGVQGATPFTQSSGTAEGSAVTINSGPVSDIAGNTTAGINSAAFKIDLSDPTNVRFVNGVAANGSYYFGSVPAAPTCTADDAVSGLASCTVSGYSTSVGTHTLIATATDNAGRTATEQLTYQVLGWTVKGFYNPVAMTPAGAQTVWNTVKNGSTVPLKFEVFAGSTELTDTAVVSALAKQVTCNAGTEDTVDVLATGGTSLRYDWDAGQFVYNWQTPKLAGKCYAVTATMNDGSSITAHFKLK